MSWPSRLVALVLVLALAGCFGGGSQAGASANGPAKPGASLTGVVVDLAVRPLVGATATVAGLPSAVTGPDGTFRITGLEPGVVLVEVAKPGYLTTVVEGVASREDGAPVLKVVLDAVPETIPFLSQESYSGLLDCGVGSGALAGMSVRCTGTAVAGANNLCHGAPPFPPTGVCLEDIDPYFEPQARGNITITQTELTWEPTLAGQSELLLSVTVVDAASVFVAGPDHVPVTGPPFLVERLNATFLREHDVGGANHLSVYVSTGNGPAVNVAINQAFQVFHTSTYFFEPDADWAFVRDGLPTIPPACTTCLLPG